MKVLIVYHFIARYRSPIFLELSKNTSFYFASDIKTSTDIKLIDESFYEKESFVRLSNSFFVGGLLWQKGLLREIRSGGYTHVIFLGDPHFISTWVSLILSKLLNIKTYLWTHGFINRSGFLLDSIKKLMYRLSDGVMLYGNQSKTALSIDGFPENKLHVIYNSLDYERQKTLREKYKNHSISLRLKYFQNESVKPLIFIGRLTYHKKLEMLIHALASLVSEGELNYRVVLIGDGEAKHYLTNLASELGVSSYVLFYGSCHKEEELAPLLSMSVACVSPGEIGLTAMHCAAYGLPIVTHNNSLKQMPEYEVVIDDFSGYLFDYGSVTSLVNAIKKIKADSKQSLGINAIELVEKYYTPKKQADFIRDALNEK